MPARYREHPDLMERTAPAELVRRSRDEGSTPGEPVRDVGDPWPATPAPESASTRATGNVRGTQHLRTGSSKHRSFRYQEDRPVRWPAFPGGCVLSCAAHGRADAGGKGAGALYCLLDEARLSGSGCRETQISGPISK